MKKVPILEKRHRGFSFQGGFEAGIQTIGNLPDLHPHFALECDGRAKERSCLLDLS